MIFVVRIGKHVPAKNCRPTHVPGINCREWEILAYGSGRICREAKKKKRRKGCPAPPFSNSEPIESIGNYLNSDSIVCGAVFAIDKA